MRKFTNEVTTFLESRHYLGQLNWDIFILLYRFGFTLSYFLIIYIASIYKIGYSYSPVTLLLQ